MRIKRDFMREFDFLNIPIVDIVNEIIIDSVKRNASDIHFDPMENYLKIRIRIDGSLMDYAIIENKYKRNLITVSLIILSSTAFIKSDNTLMFILVYPLALSIPNLETV